MFAQSSILINPARKQISIFNGKSFFGTESYRNISEIESIISHLCEDAGYNPETITKIVQDIPYDTIQEDYNCEIKIISQETVNVIYGFILGVICMILLTPLL